MPDVQLPQLQNLVITAIGTLLRMAFILVLALLSYGVLRTATYRLERFLVREGEELAGERAAARARTISSLLRSTALVTIIVVTGIMLLDQVGLNITPILAGVGIVGLAVGVGAQTLVKDSIAGLFILIEQQFDVGDRITTKGITGVVESISLRTTIVRDSDGTQHVIPNGEIRILSNRSKDWARAVIDMRVSAQEPIGHVLAALRTTGEALRQDPELGAMVIEAPQVEKIEEASQDEVVLRVTTRVQPGKQEIVAQELRRRLRERFESAEVQIVSA